jgi:membrane-bound serine protease (ClpP class)
VTTPLFVTLLVGQKHKIANQGLALLSVRKQEVSGRSETKRKKVMATLTKYLLMQAPGWALTGLILLGLRDWIGFPLWAGCGLFIMWAVKDLALYPFVRTAYESNVKTGAEQLVGARGVAQEWLSPHGYVQVHGELWRAEVEPSDQLISPRSPVRVRAARGMTLIVTGEKGETDSLSGNLVPQ